MTIPEVIKLNASTEKTTKARAQTTLHAAVVKILKPFINGRIFDSFIREEVLSLTITKIFLNLNSYDASRSFEAWIKVICRNTIIDYLRANKIPQHETNEWCELPVVEKYEWSDLSHYFKRVISRMHQRDREVILMRVYQGYDCKAIARKLNLPDGTVLTILHRFRQQVKASGLMAA